MRDTDVLIIRKRVLEALAAREVRCDRLDGVVVKTVIQEYLNMFPTTIEEVEAEEKRQQEEDEEINPSLHTAEEVLEKLLPHAARWYYAPSTINPQIKENL